MSDMPATLVLDGREWDLCVPGSAAELLTWLDGRHGHDAARCALVATPQVEILATAIRAGVRLILTDADPSPRQRELIEADLARHGCHAAASLASALLQASRQVTAGAGRRLDISDRERTILELVAQGESNRLIAAQLFLSEHTVRNHLSRTFRKLGVSTRGEAAQALRDEGGAGPSS